MSHYEIPQRIARPAAFTLPPERLNAGAAVASGIFCGAVMLGLLIGFANVIYGEEPWKLLRMIAATVHGREALAPAGEFDARLALLGGLMHFLFSILYALALTGLLVECRKALAPWLGLAFGVGLYFANLHGFTLIFPWFEELRTVDTFVAHAFFGLLITQAYAAFSEIPDAD
jgi:uncharacterized membrane protein YagU involved in acid resistance